MKMSPKTAKAIDAALKLSERDGHFTARTLAFELGLHSTAALSYYLKAFRKFAGDKLTQTPGGHWRISGHVTRPRRISCVRMSDAVVSDLSKLVRGLVHDLAAPWESFADAQSAADYVVEAAIAALHQRVLLAEFRSGGEAS